jgi:hypothetical protein
MSKRTGDYDNPLQQLMKSLKTQNIIGLIGLGVGIGGLALALSQYVRAQPPPPEQPPPPSPLRLTLSLDQGTVTKGTPITVTMQLSDGSTDIANKPLYLKVFNSNRQDVTNVFTSTPSVTTDLQGKASVTLNTSNASAGTYTLVVATSREELTI